LLILGALALLALAGCFEPYTPPYVDPYPYSFTDSSKPYYPQSRYGAMLFVDDARELWIYENNTGIRYPQESARLMRGDCDDFAVMLACYLQEYFGYDTFVLRLTVDGTGHECAFIVASSSVVNLDGCYAAPIITHRTTGAEYYPVDWDRCPWWTWSDPGSPVGGMYEWSDLAGNSQLSAE